MTIRSNQIASIYIEEGKGKKNNTHATIYYRLNNTFVAKIHQDMFLLFWSFNIDRSKLKKWIIYSAFQFQTEIYH